MATLKMMPRLIFLLVLNALYKGFQMKYNLFQKFCKKVVKIKETSFLLSKCCISIAHHCTFSLSKKFSNHNKLGKWGSNCWTKYELPPGLRHKLYKLPKPVRYTSSKPLNYTPKPGNYTNIWNHLPIQMLKPLKYTPKPLKYMNKKVKTQNIYNWNY